MTMRQLAAKDEGTTSAVQIHLFGGVAAFSNAGEPIDVGPAKCQAVLAGLALSPSTAVPVWRLVELVWGSEPPRTAEKTLQSYVVRLRKGLGPGSILRTGAAYKLDIEPDAIDVVRFQRCIDAGDIGAALDEWTGVPLAGLEAEGFTGIVDGLFEQWLGALEADLERRVESDAASAVGQLTELTASYPFREGFWALLMTALYRVGRQADALAAYRTARGHLVEQLGAEPGPRLRELESLILGHDEQLAVDRASSASAAKRPTGTVTFGFSDIDGSTGLWASRPQQMAYAMARYDEIITTATLNNDGFAFSTRGDSYAAAFHRVSDAVAWAREIQAALSDENWSAGVEIRPRIGLHTGEAEERGADYFGPAVNVAERLSAAGHGGQTLISGATSTLHGVSTDVRDLGTHRLEGVVADQRILQLDSGEFPVPRTEDSHQGRLPQRLGRLLGRADALDTVCRALLDSPVVTLVGPGGIGKTRLALATAQYADPELGGQVWLVELAGISSSSEVSRAVGDALGVREKSQRSLTQSIVADLHSRRALVVLDNCEHVIDGAADMAQAIAEGCPDVHVLATSREGLGLAGEQLIAVAPLEPAGPGVELFNERALATDQAFDVEAYRDDVEEICRRLDGVPLAIELAAARTRSLSPSDLLERLDDHLRLLTGGRRAGVERHRTLRATIQWSYELLGPSEQELYRRLSIFIGPFDLSAAEVVASEEGPDVASVDELLSGLVDRSMLIVESGPFGRRFRLLETMRQFGAERLYEMGDTDSIARRHARWCVGQVNQINLQLMGRSEVEGVARLTELWPNLRAAFDWACVVEDYELAYSLVRPVVLESSLRGDMEITDWVERLLAIAPAEETEVIAFALTWASHRYTRRRDSDAYVRLVGQYGDLGDPLVYYALAMVAGDTPEMTRWAAPVVTKLREQGDAYMAEFYEIGGIGGTLLMSERFDDLDEHIATLLERYRTKGPSTYLNWVLVMSGFAALLQGKNDEANAFFEESTQVELPYGTDSLNKPIEARGELHRGRHIRAFQILRSCADDLVDLDIHRDLRTFACVEFTTMMTKIDNMPDAARMAGHLETTGLFETPVFKELVSEVTERIAESEGPLLSDQQILGRELDEGQALEFMVGVLDRLIAEG